MTKVSESGTAILGVVNAEHIESKVIQILLECDKCKEEELDKGAPKYRNWEAVSGPRIWVGQYTVLVRIQ